MNLAIGLLLVVASVIVAYLVGFAAGRNYARAETYDLLTAMLRFSSLVQTQEERVGILTVLTFFSQLDKEDRLWDFARNLSSVSDEILTEFADSIREEIQQ